jgi:uncharacterized protein (DUF3820 family)
MSLMIITTMMEMNGLKTWSLIELPQVIFELKLLMTKTKWQCLCGMLTSITLAIKHEAIDELIN